MNRELGFFSYDLKLKGHLDDKVSNVQELPQLASSNEFTQNIFEKILRKIYSVIYKLAIKMYTHLQTIFSTK